MTVGEKVRGAAEGQRGNKSVEDNAKDFSYMAFILPCRSSKVITNLRNLEGLRKIQCFWTGQPVISCVTFTWRMLVWMRNIIALTTNEDMGVISWRAPCCWGVEIAEENMRRKQFGFLSGPAWAFPSFFFLKSRWQGIINLLFCRLTHLFLIGLNATQLIEP